jgi:membrane protease subunit (stomatin/prohibitin family)
VLPPGRHTMSTQNIPFLNNLINKFTGGDVFISEIFFVKTAPVRSVPFGGPIGDMIDPLTGEQVIPRIFGEFSLVVTDPVRFIVGYTGQAAQGDNDAILHWVKGLFMNGVKTTLGELCEVEGKSVLQAVSLTTKLANAFIANAPDLNEIGVRILQMGQFNLNFSEEDRIRLVEANAEIAKANRGVKIAESQAKAKQFELDQKFGQDSRYVKELAGSYQGYAAGQAMIGAGQGMAEHGVGEGGVAGAGMQMAIGVGMANQMGGAFNAAGSPQQGQQQAQAPSFTPGGAMTTCARCNTRQPGGKFCAECGGPLAQAKKFCTGCGNETGTAKFCANCGTSANAAPPA